MGEKSSFFNSISGDRKYSADSISEYWATLITNGVFPSGLQVLSNSGMTVTVKAGNAYINGRVYINDSDLSLTIPIADGTLSRIYRVVVQLSLSNRIIQTVLKAGTLASSPVAPALQQDSDIFELGIADIYVAKGVITIPQAKITDLRLTTLCGLVNSLIEVDTGTLNAQLTDSFNTWFTTIKNTLNGDIAGNLSTLITNNTTAISALDSKTYKKSDWTSGTGTNSSWRKDPDGFITQSGTMTITGNSTALTFPTTFTTLTPLPTIQMTVRSNTTPVPVTLGYSNQSLSQVQMRSSTDTVAITWTATGY